MQVTIAAVLAGAIFGALGALFDGDPVRVGEVANRGAFFAVAMGVFYFVMGARAKRDAG